MDEDDVDPLRFEYDYPIWVVALSKAGGPLPDVLSPDDPTIEYLIGSAGTTGFCLQVFTDLAGAEEMIKGLRLPGAKMITIPSALEFLVLLESFSAHRGGGVVFDLRPSTKTVLPYRIQGLIDDLKRKLLP